MKKYNLLEFQLSPEKEQKFIEETVLDGTLEEKVIIDGEEYLQFANPTTGESVLIKPDIEKFYREFIYDIIDDNIKGDIGTALDIFGIAIKRFFNREKIVRILKKTDIVFLKNVFVNYRATLQEKGIDICEYASILAVYQDLLANYHELSQMKDKSREMQILATAVQDAKRIIDDEVESCGGLEEWIEKRELTKKRAYNVYTKDRLLEKILSKNSTAETNKKYAELLLSVGFSTKDLYRLIIAGEITPFILKQLYNIQELKKIVKETVGKFDTYNAMMSFFEIEEADVLDKFNWNQVKVEELKRIIETTDGVTVTNMTLFIIELCKSREKGLSEQEIDEILESKATSKHDKLRAYFELAKHGIYSENKIIDFFEDVETEKLEDPYGQQVKNLVSIQELTTLFSTDKIISRMEEYSEQDNGEGKTAKERLLYFYYALLEAYNIRGKEEAELIKNELYSKLKERVNAGENKAVLIAIELLEYQILDREKIKKIIENEEILLDLYNNGIDDDMLLYLYSNRIVSTDLVELVYEGITSEELTEKIEDGQIAPMNMAKLYLLGIIDFEQLGECDFGAIAWIQLLKICKEIDVTNRIAILYKNGYIDFEIIKQLKEEQIISAKEAEIILNQLDLEEILTNGLTSPEGVGDGRKRKRIEGRVKKEGISLEDRDELFEALGFNAITNQEGEILVVADGSFKGYRVYRDTQRNFGVIVFENNSDGSSFIMHEAKAGEFIKAASNETKQATLLGSRSYWRERARTDGSVTAKMHSIHWGKNIIEAIVDTSSTFKFDDEETRRKYIKTETRRLCEEHKDIIDYIRLIKQEQREQ